jgi:hypothetical protein
MDSDAYGCIHPWVGAQTDLICAVDRIQHRTADSAHSGGSGSSASTRAAAIFGRARTLAV